MAVGTIVSAIIMAGTAIAGGIAKNVSGKRAAEAQGRVDDANEQFSQETSDINRQMQQEDIDFGNQMFGKKKKIDTANLMMQEKGLQDQQSRLAGQRRGAVMSEFLGEGDTAKKLGTAQQNISRLTGGR